MNWAFLVVLSAVCAAVAELVKKRVLRDEHALEFSAARTILTGLLTLSLIPLMSGIPSGPTSSSTTASPSSRRWAACTRPRSCGTLTSRCRPPSTTRG